MNPEHKIYIAGHRGLVGNALVKALHHQGYQNLITRTHEELELTNQEAVNQFFSREKPHYVFLAAARVGGILDNIKSPAEFIRDNLLIQTHIIDAAFRFKCSGLVFFASSSIYPLKATQPFKEDSLLTDRCEPTNEAYAIAKIAGIQMLKSYQQQYGFRGLCLIPPSLYGPHDKFGGETSHLMPALISKFADALHNRISEVSVWGTGQPLREFLHVDDLAQAAIYLMKQENLTGIINVGSGKEISIRELVALIQEVIGYQGSIHYDTSKPDGNPRKLMDISYVKQLGWSPGIALRQGILQTYLWYKANHLNQ